VFYLFETADTSEPINVFINVDFPALGAPKITTDKNFYSFGDSSLGLSFRKKFCVTI